MSLDQYYTSPQIAQDCIGRVYSRYESGAFKFVEPSAGTGAFLSLCPEGSLGFDLDPQYPGIVEQDFLTANLFMEEPMIFVGNPPFGKNASLAIQFFNHAAEMAQVIAFILPRTFRKASVTNRLDRRFHLVEEDILPRDSFIFEGAPYDVPCVFQIWERCDVARDPIAVETRHPDFEFTTRDRADFAIQRVGVNAGRVKLDLSLSEQSHYFIKGDVIEVMRSLDFDSVKYDTAGNPSVAKSEIIALYRAYFD